MTAEEWVSRYARALGVAPPTPEEIDGILRLASVAAHSSERRAAPVACWLAARAGLDPEAARAAASFVPDHPL